MLPRKSLLPLKKDFERIHKTGKIYDSSSFGLVVSFGAKDGPGAAFIVSKKIDRKSVIRHEVKRKLSDAASPFLPRLKNNTELVFLAKQKAKEATKEELTKETETILERARLLT
ncbi:ribonuclease P protein component [Candidatus Microgenomates bacterium]|nr:ribonuclease P protein component [Candidatus Microgenomates bacterium]